MKRRTKKNLSPEKLAAIRANRAAHIAKVAEENRAAEALARITPEADAETTEVFDAIDAVILRVIRTGR